MQYLYWACLLSINMLIISYSLGLIVKWSRHNVFIITCVGSNPTEARLLLVIILVTITISYADWCNRNITGSWPVNIGANPLSALNKKIINFLLKKKREGYSLIGKASCSWQLRWVFKSLWPYKIIICFILSECWNW